MEIPQPLQNLPTPRLEHLGFHRSLRLPYVAPQRPRRHQLGNKTNPVPPVLPLGHPRMVQIDDAVMLQAFEYTNLLKDALSLFFDEMVDSQLVPGDFDAFFGVVGLEDFFVGAFS